MKKLVDGVRHFHSDVYPALRGVFQELADGQSPLALFISCSDSRVSADMITQSQPGDLFVLRNAGNLIPPHGASHGGEGATIEYAVSSLGIRHIIVCGHSSCGAMKAMLHPESLTELPAVSRWLRHAEATRLIMKQIANGRDPADLVDEASKANVLVQLDNLRSHPAVAAGLARGALFLHGWFYDFLSGHVFAYDPMKSAFLPIAAHIPVAAVPPGRVLEDLPRRTTEPRTTILLPGWPPRLDKIGKPSAPKRAAKKRKAGSSP